MRISSNLVKKSALIILALMFVIVAGLLPIIVGTSVKAANEYESPAFADTYDCRSGTWLNQGGLQVGDNKFLTRSGDDGGYKNGTGQYYNARDIYVESSTAFTYSSASLQMDNGTAKITLPLFTPATDATTVLVHGGVYYALKDADYAMKLIMGGTVSNLSSGSETTVTITISWYALSGSGATATSTKTLSLNAGDSDVSMSPAVLEIDPTAGTNVGTGSYFQVTISSSGNIAIASPSLDVGVSSSKTVQIGADLVYEISGKNRQTVGPMTSGNEGGIKYYVKAGDTVTLRAKVFQGDATMLYKFPDYYATIFGLTNTTGIYWSIYSTDANGAEDSEVTYTSKVSGSEKIVSVGDTGDWYEVQYTIKDGVGNVESISFVPSVYYKKDASGSTAATKKPLEFKVDDSAPSAPEIDPESDFGMAIQNATWYTGSLQNNPTLKFAETTHTVKSYEYIYAFVVPSGVITPSGLSSYDYTPSTSGTEGQALEYVQGSSAYRQQVVSYNAKGARVTNACDFGTGGKLGLILISVDAAGNVSDPTYYTDYSGYPVYIDGSTYAVGVSFILGEAVLPNTRLTTVGTVYIITGAGTHDENGNLIEGNYHTSNVYKKTNGTYGVARLEWVTIRIAMTASQYSNYRMVSYTNKAKINGENPTFVPPEDTNRPYYVDLPTFQVTDEFADNQKGIIDCVFRSRVNLKVIGATTDGTIYETYTGDNISIADSVEVHTNDKAATLIQGLKLSLTYYKIYEYSASYLTGSDQVEIKMSDESTYKLPTYEITTKGQTVTINGVRYNTISSTAKLDNNGKKYYSVKCYCPDEPRLDDQGYSLGFIDAGNYWYNAAISADDINYFGDTSGILVINKASPNVTDISANELIYGTIANDGRRGLELLEFESLSQDGTRLLYSSAGNRYIFDQTYYDSYYGVLGLYTIVTPTTLDSSYYYPDVSDSMTITVRFTPIDIGIGAVYSVLNPSSTGESDKYISITIDEAYIKENYSVMSRYYNINPDGSVSLKEGGLHAGNYSEQVLVLNIVVKHALVEKDDIEVVSGYSAVYDGTQKPVILSTNPADLPYIVLYKQKDADASTYSTDAPFGAGEYTVKYYIDNTACNYYSEAQEIGYTIQKRELSIDLMSYTDITNTPYNYVEGGKTFSARVDMDYGYFTRPSLQAYYLNDYSEKVIVNVVYYIQYKMVEDHDGRNVYDFEETERKEEDQIDSRSVQAGLYIVTLSINNSNNSGAITCLVKVAQASSSGSSNLMVTYPALNSSYTAYSLKQNAVITIGSDSTIGNIEYGQTIREMEEKLIQLTDTTYAQYLFRNEQTRTIISGRFYLETEATILSRYGLPLTTKNKNGELILPVKYDLDNFGEANDIASYDIYLYWQAGEYDKDTGDFIPNNNFVVEGMKVTFYVVRSTPKFDSVTLSTLTYGDTLAKATFVGIPEVSGGMNIGGINVSGDAKEIIEMNGNEFSGKQVLVAYQADGKVAYVLGYELSENTLFQRGSYEVDSIFIPANDFAKNYRKVMSIKIKISVVAKPATIEFVPDKDGHVSHNFSELYSDPEVVTNPKGVAVRFEFYTLDDEQFTLTSRTPVGQYKVKAIVSDENYEGELISDFYVVRSALTLSIAPANDTQYYGVTLGEIALSPGRCFSKSSVAVDGTFAFVNTDLVPEVGTSYYLVRFTPYDETAYDSYLVFEYNYALTINKAPVEILFSDLVHTYDGLGKTPTLHAEDPQGNELEVAITYTNWVPTVSVPLPELAGLYTLNLTVNTNHYYQSINVTMEIKKAYATIDATPQYVKYTGAPKTYVPKFDVDGLTYTLSYRNYYDTVVSAPQEIGEYVVTVTINHTNYQGTKDVKMYIEPYSYEVQNLEQVYSLYGNKAVTATFLPTEINYSVLYRSVGSVGEFSTDIPTEAGDYDVIVRISQDGYIQDKTTMIVGGVEKPILLSITPAVANIEAPAFTRIYSARAHTDLSCTVTPSVSVSYQYRAAGTTDEYTSVAPILAGTYDVLVSVSDKNYTGTATTTLLIDKATPIIGTLPTISSTNYFNTTKDAVTFAKSGSVIFTATGEYITELGHWEIDEDDESFMFLPVGTYSVKVKFVPDDEDNFYPARFFDSGATERATMSIIISKKDIGSYIGFDESQLYQMYKAKQLSVDAFMTDTSVLVEGYAVPTLVVTYNGQQIRPTTVGDYVLGAYIIDDNYTGNATETVFHILKADLAIRVPDVDPVEMNTPIGTVESSLKYGGGYAYIPQDEGDVMSTVSGTFAFAYPDTQFDRANYQKVWVTFTPNDVLNYNVHNFQMEIFVKGVVLDIRGVAATGITYGQKLSESTLTYTSIKEYGTDNEVSGSFSWKNPDEILTTGEHGKYVFTPDEHDKYNIVEGEVAIEVAQAEMWLDTTTLEAKVYCSDTAVLNDAILAVDIYHDDHRLDSDWLVSGASIKLSTQNSNLDKRITTAGEVIEGVLVVISHRDYESIEMRVAVRTYQGLTDNDFQITSDSKIYDGNKVTVADFGVKLANTDYQIYPEDYKMTIRKDGQVLSEMVDAGRYEVTLSIYTKYVDDLGTVQYRNVKFDGSYSFIYTIEKLDITDSIDAKNLTKTYGDYSTSVEGVFGEYEVDSSHAIYNYFSADKTKSYGVIAPQYAGTYIVAVSVSEDNVRYKGTKEFVYTIERCEATINLNSTFYVVYGNKYSIEDGLVISNNISIDDCTVTYNGSQLIPENVGSYLVKVVIVDPNFKGEATANLTIDQATPVLDEYPSLTSIVYGQELFNSIISGGKATIRNRVTGKDEEVLGEFVFENPSDNSLNAGTNYVAMRFEPFNTNYSKLPLEASIVVKKGVATIELINPTAVYDGTDKAPVIVTQPLAGLDVKMVFRQNTQIRDAINAGVYEVTITIDNPNYEGSAVFPFTIQKASPYQVTLPTASDLSYGQSLIYSSLTGGQVVYMEGGRPVQGEFVFKNSALQLGDVGRYRDVQVDFIPADEDNYNRYEGVITVRVIKAVATIRATNTTFTYGEHITAPVFVTSPDNLTVDNSDFVYSGLLGEVPHVGTYEFSAAIQNKNYEGSLTYVISITKKKLTVNFVNSNNAKVERYTTKYNSTVYAKALIDSSTVVSQDLAQLSTISSYLTFYYGTDTAGYNHLPPMEVGEYYVYCDMNNADYYIDSTTLKIPYTINRATVDYLEFDTASLSNQVYGSVSVPTVVSSPSGINCIVTFPGYDTMPTDAGTYSIKVLVTDDNYEPAEKSSMFRILPKDVTVESITCSNRVVDGTTNISVKGELKGVLVGDEVFLTMTAVTEGGETLPGTYPVKITSYVLSGLHAGNYNVLEPVYSLSVKLRAKQVEDPSTGSYITSNSGLSENITVTFSEVKDSQNKSNVFSSMFGQDVIVETFEIKENGIRSTLAEKVKVYVKIPEKFRSSSNIIVEGMGDLSTETINFSREGDYITFYTDKSGEVAIYTKDFPYWVIIVIGVVAMVVIGLVCVFIFWPIKRRKRIPASVRRMHALQVAEEKRIKKLEKQNNPSNPWDKYLNNFQ